MSHQEKLDLKLAVIVLLVAFFIGFFVRGVLALTIQTKYSDYQDSKQKSIEKFARNIPCEELDDIKNENWFCVGWDEVRSLFDTKKVCKQICSKLTGECRETGVTLVRNG